MPLSFLYQVYEMEVPEQPGEVQKDFKLGKTGKYVLSIKVCVPGPPLGFACAKVPGP